MKKFVSNILLLIAVIALVLVTREAETANAQLLWSGTWMAVVFICAKAWEKLNPEEKENL